MKSVYTFILLLLINMSSFSQLAQSYFPTQPGFSWIYRVTPLDSLNEPVSSFTYYQVDSFAVVQNYQGKNASYVLSKSGAALTLPFQPYIDTSYLSFQNNDAYKYYRLFTFDSLFSGIGNRNVGSKNINYSLAVESFEGWFAYYKFAQVLNIHYQIFSKDTSITFDTLTFPIRYELKGKRLADQTITTELGSFTCKKFLLSTVLSYLPLPILPIPLYTLYDTTWIAPNNWIVKQTSPSSVINLSPIGFGSYVFPGSMKEIIPELLTGIKDESSAPNDFNLYQNYPNPFNPVTKIKFSIQSVGTQRAVSVQLKVYDILGNEVATLVDEYKPAGNYEVEFKANGLSSGIYFYKLIAGNYSSTLKMMLLR